MRILIFSLLALVKFIAAAASNSTPVVDIGYAQYQGLYDSSTNTSTFFGIRYAQPPIGECREPGR